jgi:CheY-like chemotaxis protein/two-component sensor histidine kinase
LAMLAHELRNPLTPIRTGLEIVQKNLGDQNRRDWALQVIDRQLVQLTRIIDDLLELARIANGNITLKKEMVSLRTLVANAVETSRPHINARRHVLRVDLPLHEIRLHVDTVRLAQAIANLLSNAAKFTEPGGTIAVKAETADGMVKLCVQDSGRGIDPELLPRVFDVFVQGKQSVARTEGGLGVGLSIVRRIVELHGGSVDATSKGPGRGSEFVLRLPIVAEGTERATIEASHQENGPKRRRVLIVDDNRDVADTIGEFLRLHGHEVEQHYDGNGVLEKALAFQADVLVIDLGLPGRDGFAVARDVRAHPALRRLPLIAISGYGQPADIERGREAGLNFHLVKPVDTQLLMKLIEVNVGPLNN